MLLSKNEEKIVNREIFVFCVYAVFSLSIVQADLLFFTDRASFESALSSPVVHDFESTANGALGNIFSIGDARVVSTNNSGIFGTTGFGSTSRVVGSQNGGSVRVELNPGFRALGMEIGELFGSRTDTFSLVGENGVLDSGSLSVAHVGQFQTPNTTFYGWISEDEDIVSITWDGGFETIDTLTYANFSGQAVPEPTSFFLLALALFGLTVKKNSSVSS